MNISELSFGNARSVVPLYRRMILEHRSADPRLHRIPIEDNELYRLISASIGQAEDAFLLLSDGETLVGFIDATILKRREDGKPETRVASIKSVFLIDGYRTIENLRVLERRVREIVKERGVDRIETNALMDDAEANRIWESLGYRPEGRRRAKDID